MKNTFLRGMTLLVALCCIAVGVASAGNVSLAQLGSGNQKVTGTVVNVNEPFPTAGDAYCSATNGCGNIPAGGQTAFMWTTGDFVISSIFMNVPSNTVTDITANWSYQDFLGGGNTETWFALVNGIAVAQATLPDDKFNGDILTVTGTVNFAAIAAVAGGYQVELVLQNTVPTGGGSAAWLDGGITGLSYNTTTVPEPGSMMLLGTGVIGVAGLLRRKLGV